MVRLQAGELLSAQGGPGDALFVLLDGELERRHQLDGKLKRSAVRPLATLDELACLAGSARPSSLVAASDARLWRVPRTALLEAFDAEPQAARGLVILLSARLRQANDALERHPFTSLATPLARFLLAARNARAVVPLTQTEIARQLSASREKVNRKLNGWAREGWVELSRAGVRVCDPEALRRLLPTEPQTDPTSASGASPEASSRTSISGAPPKRPRAGRSRPGA